MSRIYEAIDNLILSGGFYAKIFRSINNYTNAWNGIDPLLADEKTRNRSDAFRQNR